MADALGRKTGGRAKGTPNKATADVKALAQKHGPSAIKELARLMVKAESEAARVAACNAILDRAYGKSKQPVVGGEDDDNPIRTALEVTIVRAKG